jgi:hypothetical protein
MIGGRPPRPGSAVSAATPLGRRSVAKAAANTPNGGVPSRLPFSSLDASRRHRLNAERAFEEYTVSMEIYLDRRAVRQVRLSAQEAIEEGDTESLREDILESFTEEQVEEIERHLDTADFYEFLTDVLDEWSGDDVDELFELLETQLGEIGIDLKTDTKSDDDDDDDDDDEEEEDEDEEDPDVEEEMLDDDASED